MADEAQRIPHPPGLDEIAAWMDQHGVQKLTLNRDERKNEVKMEVSLYATRKISLPVGQTT